MAGASTNIRPAAPQARNLRSAVEALTLAVLLAPSLWLAWHWRWIPVVSPHFHRSRMSLWLMPAFACAVYLVLSEFGLPSKMDILRPGHRLSGLRPVFRAYLMTARLELLAFFGVLSIAMDRAAMTGRWWSARGFKEASLTVILLTILLFTVKAASASYRLDQPAARL